jgi:hypothetical protein
MSRFVQIGDTFINSKFLKKAHFDESGCWFTIANTNVVASGTRISSFNENDIIMNFSDKVVCDKVKNFFKNL